VSSGPIDQLDQAEINPSPFYFVSELYIPSVRVGIVQRHTLILGLEETMSNFKYLTYLQSGSRPARCGTETRRDVTATDKDSFGLHLIIA
jgi:hypothetical protein